MLSCTKKKLKFLSQRGITNYFKLTQPEPILPIRRIRKRRAPKHLALKDVLILVSFFSLVSGYEIMNDYLL